MTADVPGRLALIEDFLDALNRQGITVGPFELDRLRHLFARRPELDRRGLKTLLRAALIKKPAQGPIFDAQFEIWCPDQDADWRPAPSSPKKTAQPSHANESQTEVTEEETFTPSLPWWRSKWLYWSAGLVAIVLALFLAWPWLFPTEEKVVQERLPEVRKIEADPKPPASTIETLPATPVDKVWYWQASIDPEAVHTAARLDPLRLTLLGLTALAIAVYLLLRHRTRFPELKPKQRQAHGPGWQPLPATSGGPLIGEPERRRVLWHIEHFVSDEPTHRLDLNRTVTATARAAGFVQAHFEPATYERSVRFWLDRQLRAPSVRQAVAELASTLGAGGIEVQQGYFTDVPHRVDDAHQRGYQPVHEEGSGREAIVAIFCDGEGLGRQLEHPLQQQRAHRLLRSLQHWPKLCFVDCSAQGRCLEELFKRHHFRLEVITRDQLPTWLGGLEAGPIRQVLWQNRLVGDEWVWAAALALNDAPVSVGDARALGKALDIDISPWRAERVGLDAADTSQRAALINRLLRCEPLLTDSNLPRADSLVQRALDWWRERYQDADIEKSKSQNPLLPWGGSRPQRRWRLESELLRLYIDPQEATARLTELVQADAQLAAELRARLQGFMAEDDPRDDAALAERIRFTWRFGDLPIETRHSLVQLGFDIDTARELSPLPPPLALSVGALAGLATAALAMAAWYTFRPPLPQLLADPPYDDPVLAAQTLRIVEPLSDNDRYRLLVGSPRELAEPLEVGVGTLAPVVWSWKPQTNQYEFPVYKFPVSQSRLHPSSLSRVLRAGTLAQPTRACGKNWPARSLVIIHAPKDDKPARQLAIRLLDLGSADQVLIGIDWSTHLREWLGPSETLNRQTQLLIILPTSAYTAKAAASLRKLEGPWAIVKARNFAAPAWDLVFRNEKAYPKRPFDRNLLGVNRIDAVRLSWNLEARRGAVYLYGGPERTEEKGIEWVRLCPGTFTFGVLPEERIEVNKGFDEIYNPPGYTVVLPTFDVAATETTRAQYSALVPEVTVEKPDSLPMANVRWQEARRACIEAGGDLPTEAQWEYAARGGSRSGWSFGNDEATIGNYAWFRDNSGDTSQPVGELAPNPFGLYDIHGNVWEWIRDRNDAYPTDAPPIVDPRGPTSSNGGRRVLRGGSFVHPPKGLRSANRFDNRPEFWGRDDGFRCARVPPQP